MLLDIKKLLFQIDNIEKSMRGINLKSYNLLLDSSMTIIIKSIPENRNKNRMIHIHSLKKLFDIYIKNVDMSIAEFIKYAKFDESKYLHIKEWDSFYSLRKEIIQMYNTLFEYYPEKLI